MRDRGEGGGDRDREMELRRRERERLKEWGREIDETEQPSGPGELGDGPLQLNMADMDEMEMMKAMGLPVDFQTTKVRARGRQPSLRALTHTRLNRAKKSRATSKGLLKLSRTGRVDNT